MSLIFESEKFGEAFGDLVISRLDSPSERCALFAGAIAAFALVHEENGVDYEETNRRLDVFTQAAIFRMLEAVKPGGQA